MSEETKIPTPQKDKIEEYPIPPEYENEEPGGEDIEINPDKDDEEESMINLKELGSIFPDKEVKGSSVDDFILYVQKIITDGGERRFKSVELPEHIFPLTEELLYTYIGPGKFVIRLYNKENNEWPFCKVFTFKDEEEVEPIKQEVIKPKEIVKEKEIDIDSKLNAFKQDIIKLLQEKSGGRTFEQELVLRLLEGNKKDVNEALLQAVTQVQAEKIKSTTEIEKAKIQQNTKLAELKHEIEKAKLNLSKSIDNLPEEISDNPEEAKSGLKAVVEGVNTFVGSINKFMEQLAYIVDVAQQRQTQNQEENLEEELKEKVEEITETEE